MRGKELEALDGVLTLILRFEERGRHRVGSHGVSCLVAFVQNSHRADKRNPVWKQVRIDAPDDTESEACLKIDQMTDRHNKNSYAAFDS